MCDLTIQLVRISGATLGTFGFFGLMAGRANVFFTVVTTFAGLLFVTSVLLTHTNRAYGALFATSAEPADGHPTRDS
jgi:hypothetical protein